MRLLRRVSFRTLTSCAMVWGWSEPRSSRCSMAFSWRPSLTSTVSSFGAFAGISIGRVEIFSSPRYDRVSTLSGTVRSEEHTSELQSLAYLVCRLLLEKKKKIHQQIDPCV